MILKLRCVNKRGNLIGRGRPTCGQASDLRYQQLHQVPRRIPQEVFRQEPGDARLRTQYVLPPNQS
jgi:hypothetical protein